MEVIFKSIDGYEADMLVNNMLNNAARFIHTEFNVNNWNILFNGNVEIGVAICDIENYNRY